MNCMLFIKIHKIVTVIVFKRMKTHETKPSISRFSANAWLRSQSDYVKQVLILCVKSAKGCRVAEWFVNPRLAKMQ